MMNIFARALGGIFGDKAGRKFGIKGRIIMLGTFLLLEGVGIMIFSTIDVLAWAIATMLIFALFLKMSNGATYSVVPFINKKAMGAVSGIVGAGGNVGAVLAGFLFTSNDVSYRDSLFTIGIAVIAVSVLSLLLGVLKTQKDIAQTQPVPETQLKAA
jgi:NNP family nitrate/nitrite transporter-like MFS transporter